MTTIWIIPLVITAVGMLLIAGFARRAADEAAAFQRTLRLAVVDVRDHIDHLRRR